MEIIRFLLTSETHNILVLKKNTWIILISEKKCYHWRNLSAFAQCSPSQLKMNKRKQNSRIWKAGKTLSRDHLFGIIYCESASSVSVWLQQYYYKYCVLQLFINNY